MTVQFNCEVENVTRFRKNCATGEVETGAGRPLRNSHRRHSAHFPRDIHLYPTEKVLIFFEESHKQY